MVLQLIFMISAEDIESLLKAGQTSIENDKYEEAVNRLGEILTISGNKSDDPKVIAFGATVQAYGLWKLNDPQMEAITLSTIAAARSLGMAIDVVGVETEEQLWFLRSHLVSSVQGYLFGKPVSADETLQKLFGNDDKVTILQTLTMEK